MSEENSKEFAFKELELLQNAIERVENIRLKFRGWYIGLLTGLTVAFYSSSPIKLTRIEYISACVLLTVIFFFIEAGYRIPETRAINRSNEVETMIREGNYKGPKIGESMRPQGARRWIPEKIEFRFYLVLITYILLHLM